MPAVEDNLRNLKLESLHLVNLRVAGLIAPAEGSIVGPMSVLASMQREGLVRNIGLNNVSPQQYEEGREIAKIVCAQNHYNVAHREDDTFIDQLEAVGWRMFQFSRWEVSRPCNLQYGIVMQLRSNARPLRSLWRGCFSARPISC